MHVRVQFHMFACSHMGLLMCGYLCGLECMDFCMCVFGQACSTLSVCMRVSVSTCVLVAWQIETQLRQLRGPFCSSLCFSLVEVLIVRRSSHSHSHGEASGVLILGLCIASTCAVEYYKSQTKHFKAAKFHSTPPPYHRYEGACSFFPYPM